jgi:hypothetical protein
MMSDPHDQRTALERDLERSDHQLAARCSWTELATRLVTAIKELTQACANRTHSIAELKPYYWAYCRIIES